MQSLNERWRKQQQRAAPAPPTAPSARELLTALGSVPPSERGMGRARGLRGWLAAVSLARGLLTALGGG